MSRPFSRHETTYAPRGQRSSPHAPQQEHPPSSTLLLRGLERSVDDEMILGALKPFRPLHARTIYDKTTGEPRGFAFVDFDSVESAMEAMRAFESRPLVLQHRQVNVTYTDRFRRRSSDTDASQPRGAGWGPRYNGGAHQDKPHGERWQPRPDWICDECNVTNFARRTSCFQCNAPKTAHTKEVPVTAVFRQEHMRVHDFHGGGEPGNSGSIRTPPSSHAATSRDEVNIRKRGAGDENVRNVSPSQVLMVRMLPPDIEEGELQVAFAEFDGVQDIRLIRDRITNLSRGFGFVEFVNVEAATNALHKCDSLLVQSTHVEVSYARDTLSTRSHYSTGFTQGPRADSSMAVTALEQAQWSLSQGRGAETATNDQNTVAADVSALLDCAAAEVVPHIEEPKKKWPPPFETAGGSYVYVSEYGLYWDSDSMFYYNAHTKIYYNSFIGTYYRCVNPGTSGTAAFQVFVPPTPMDDYKYEEATSIKASAVSKPALSISLKKDKKKGLGISFGIKATSFTSTSSVFEKPNAATSVGAGAPGTSAISATSIGMKRKSANDIAKWAQRQREAKQQDLGESASASAQQQQTGGVASVTPTVIDQAASASAASNTADSVINALTNISQEVPICLLCRRKFGSLELLRKHEKMSKLHLANLAKAKENKQHIAAQYRKHEKEMERVAKKQRQEQPVPLRAAVPASTPVSDSGPEHTTNSLESGIGGKMLKMMGWKSGEGLGKHGTGITAPINAVGQGGRSDTAGLGSKAPLSASVDLSDVTSDKERRQRLARARYDADNA